MLIKLLSSTRRQRYTKAPSFLSIHMGVRAGVLPPGTECHHICVDAWADMEAPLGTVFVSIPTLLDPGLAPSGAHIVHIFTPDWIDSWKVGRALRVPSACRERVQGVGLLDGIHPHAAGPRAGATRRPHRAHLHARLDRQLEGGMGAAVALQQAVRGDRSML